MTRRLVLTVAVVACTACNGGERWGAPDAVPDVDGAVGEEPRRGGWDANSGNWNGNLGSWETLAGIGMNPDWAAGGTGPGTLTNAMVFGIQPAGSTALAPCDAPTAGVLDVRFTSSAGSAAGALGPDVHVVRGSGVTPLAMGEEVVFAARAFDGYLRNIEVTARVRRVDTLVKADALWYAWPVFELQVCEHARPHRGYVHLGYVSWAPMLTLPEREGEAFTFHDDIVMPITTVARPEYAGDPMVPPSVRRQGAALWFKFAFYASLPISLDDTLPFTTSAGRTIANNAFLRDGALALGNASWVYSEEEEDAGVPETQRHWFPAFFTQDGTEVAMFAIGRGDGGAHGVVQYPAAWGGGVIGALELTPAELSVSAAYSLDAVHGAVTEALMGASDRHARRPTHLASGLGTFRVGRYLDGSPSRHRLRFYWHRYANVQRASWESPVQAPIVGVVGLDGARGPQDRLRVLVRAVNSPIEHLVAGESPRPPGKPDLNSGMLVPPSPGPDGAPIDAGPDGPPGDAAEADAAPVDAPPVDAPPVDAPPVDAPPVDAAPIDAPPIDAPGLDAPPVDAAPIDAPGLDGPPIDGPPIDSPGLDGPPADGPPMDSPGLDAAIDAPEDAPTDAPEDAPEDAPTDADTDSELATDGAVEGP